MHEHQLNLTINGCENKVSGDVTQPLADVIREKLGLTGTKIGCRTGECGACTVLIDGKPVVSCLVPAASAEGHDVVTIEELSQKDDFQRLVQSMLETGGVQCGFCTPGIMVTLWAWLQDRSLFGGDISSALKNNLCRCTGYQSIIAAVEQVIAEEGGTRI
ncbi:(2Fe-2S)-binding protein [Paenibacillus lemnae]|uniref:(2Fe-2S)-binding protein n=1 Tax=Paenibacillus lemnae TaxID=1330551 RepID=A0A848M930_PAELE|nr:(2Fe-2S)-binding protein [Paenibacillus lemnae]NMO96393.1 (2Fe-2S)-binding protein [Paenibacillus lemnae]